MSNKTQVSTGSELVAAGGQRTAESKSVSLKEEEEEYDEESVDNAKNANSSSVSVTIKTTSITGFFASIGDDCNNFLSKLKPAPMIRRRPTWTRIFGSAVKVLRSLAKTIPR